MAIDDSAVQARLEEGATLYEDGNLYEALIAWKEVLALDPDNEVAQEYLSFVEENFQIGVDALLAHHEAAMGNAGPPPVPGPPPVSQVPDPPPVSRVPPPTPAQAAYPPPPPPPPSQSPVDDDAPAESLDGDDDALIDQDDGLNDAALPDLMADHLLADEPGSLASDDADDTPTSAPPAEQREPADGVVLDAPPFPVPPSDAAQPASPPKPPADGLATPVHSPRPPMRAPLPSEPALPLEAPGLDSDAPKSFSPSAAPSASIDDLPEGLPSSSVDVPLFADPSDFMQTPPTDLPAIEPVQTDEPAAVDLPPPAEIDPLAGLDPLVVASNVDAAFDALLAPADESIEMPLDDDDDDASPRALPLPDVQPEVDELAYDAADEIPVQRPAPAADDDDAARPLPRTAADDALAVDDFAFGIDTDLNPAMDVDPGADFDGDEGVAFEPEEDAADEPAFEERPGAEQTPPVSAAVSPQSAAPQSSPRAQAGPQRVNPPRRRAVKSAPMRGEPRDSGVRRARGGPSGSVERPSRSGERPSRSGERPSRSGERPSRSGERPSRAGRQDRPSGSQERVGRGRARPPVSAPLRGHAPIDSIEEMDWSEILEEGEVDGAVPEMVQPDADEAFFIEMQADGLDVEPGNEAAAWGARGSPISAPIVQHQSAPTRDPFVMPASHFVDLPDEIFADEPSIPDTWAAEAPEVDELSDGSIDIMVDKDFESWDQPLAQTDPFAQTHDADDAWDAAADAFDAGAGLTLMPDPPADSIDEPQLPFEGPVDNPLTDADGDLAAVELPVERSEQPRTTQELVSPPEAPVGFDAKPGPPPVAHQTPMSLPPLPGDPEDDPLYLASAEDPLAADEAPDWLSPTFEPGPAEPETDSLPDAFAPIDEANFFDLRDEVSADAKDAFSRADTPTKPIDDDSGSILIETRASIGEAPTLELPDTSALRRAPLPSDPPLPGDEPAAAAIFGRKRRGGVVEPSAVADARRREPTPPASPVIAIDPDIEALLRSGFEDLDAIESTGSQSLEVRQRVPSRPANDVDVNALMEQARQKQAAGDFTGSLELVEQVLLVQPDDPRAQAYMQENTARLLEMYRSRLGPLTRMPRVKLRPEEIIWQALDHRAGFLLSQVDGRTSYEDLIEIAGMSELEATRTLARLVGYELIG